VIRVDELGITYVGNSFVVVPKGKRYAFFCKAYIIIVYVFVFYSEPASEASSAKSSIHLKSPWKLRVQWGAGLIAGGVKVGREWSARRARVECECSLGGARVEREWSACGVRVEREWSTCGEQVERE
jgi:hypothetical protein